MARLLAAVALALAASACGGTVASLQPQRPAGPLFGIAGPPPARLYRLDPRTLRPRRAIGAPLDGHAFGWSFSPDRTRLAAGSDGTAELRLFDLRRLRPLGDVVLARRGLVFATTWAGPGRVLATVVTPGCCGLGDTVVAAVDVRTRRVVWRRKLGGSLQDGAPYAGGFVLVVGPRYTLGPSRLVQVAPDGASLTAPLSRIRSGWRRTGGGERFVSHEWNPGLALDRASGRAFVVQEGAPLAEVDLGTGTVRYRELSEPASVLGRLRDWLEPRAQAKAMAGPERRAVWLGHDSLAVTGVDHRVSLAGRGVAEELAVPVGLRLVDVRRGRVRTLDRSTSEMTVVGGTLFAYGLTWNARTGRFAGTGLTAHDSHGRRRYHLYGKEPISGVEPVAGAAVVAGAAGSTLFRLGALIDPASGRVLRRVRFDVTVVAVDAPFWY